MPSSRIFPARLHVSIGEKGGALEAQAIVVNDQANLAPAEIYLCAEPCPADTQDGIPTRSQQVFPPGAVLHLGARRRPSPDTSPCGSASPRSDAPPLP